MAWKPTQGVPSPVGGVPDCPVLLLEHNSPSKRGPNEHFWDAQLVALVDVGEGAGSAGSWHRVNPPSGHVNWTDPLLAILPHTSPLAVA